ncbi:unnamed protein product [Microthlaspi erraticum]|uniref:RING-type domain-containing protein n=1 Tax=Microthlaspi erraticum TaxID=1685480 RepID=A0A6D2IM59_9BRAS|nr:unnamed protein product [Microthlaspi erraticum]
MEFFTDNVSFNHDEITIEDRRRRRAVASRRALEEANAIFDETDSIIEEIDSVYEITADIQFKPKPASKVEVESLSRKVYKKTSSSDMCTICLDEFKTGERVVTLPCGHEFDDRCILEWFATNHVCPLCRFQLPREDQVKRALEFGLGI